MNFSLQHWGRGGDGQGEKQRHAVMREAEGLQALLSPHGLCDTGQAHSSGVHQKLWPLSAWTFALFNFL